MSLSVLLKGCIRLLVLCVAKRVAIDRSAEMLVQPGGVAKSYKKREESKERREEARGKRGK